MTKIQSSDPVAENLSHQNVVTAVDRLDRWGALLGLLCAVHCALTQISVFLAPVFAVGLLWTEQGELVLLGFALLCTLPSMISARRYQNGVKIISLFLLSWFLLIGTKSVEYFAHNKHGVERSALIAQEARLQTQINSHEHDPLNLSLAVLGGLGLAAAHTLNLRARRGTRK